MAQVRRNEPVSLTPGGSGTTFQAIYVRLMKSRAVLTALIAVLLFPLGAAQARAMTLADAEQVAGEYFPAAHTNCPDLTVEWGETRSETDPDAIGVTFLSQCRIVLDRAYLKPRPWRMNCLITTHEFGHASGLRFPENTADPEHSLDPDNIMYPIVSLDHLDGVTGCTRAEEQRRAAKVELKSRSAELRQSVAAYRAARRRAREAPTTTRTGFRTGTARAATLRRQAEALRPPRSMMRALTDAEIKLDCAENQEWLTPLDYCVDHKGQVTEP